MATFDLTRSFVSAFVARTLRDIEQDPERSIRNLVDLGERFTRGRFQKRFLSSAQKMLQNSNSSYYQTVKNVTTRVRAKALSTFGVNLGYNGLTRGARTIREQETVIGVNIPWMLTLDYRAGEGPSPEAYDALIDQGKRLGIYVYAFFAGDLDLPDLLPHCQRHGDCAFVVFVRPPCHRAEALTPLAAQDNCMLVLPTQDPLHPEMAAHLDESSSLFSCYTAYDQAQAASLICRDWPPQQQETGCVFAFYVAQDDVSQETREALWQVICDLREAQTQVVIPMEFYSDLLFIDQVISTQPCFLGFDAQGYSKTPDPAQRRRFYFPSLRLQALLEQTMPKATYCAPT